MSLFSKLFTLSLFILCFLIENVRGQSAYYSPAEIELIDEAVNRQMKIQGIPGVGIGIVQDAKVVLTKGYGIASIDKGTPFTEKTIINWASNSKPVMGVLILQLVERGMLKLDDKIRQYLPELPAHLDEITVRHLLSHQSGFPHYSNGVLKPLEIANQNSSAIGKLDPTVAINDFGDSALLSSPGSAYSYSSYAFILLSAVAQRAGKEDVNEQLQTRIIKPLEMTSFTLDVDQTDQVDWAFGYTNGKSGLVVADYAHYWKHGAGGYKSNIADFAKWGASLIAKTLLKESTYEEMWTPQSLSDSELTEYGLGIGATVENGIKKIFHNGDHLEATSRLVLYPDLRKGVVVITNYSGANCSRITTAIFGVLNGLLRRRE